MTSITHCDEIRTGAFSTHEERFAAFLRNTDQKQVQLKATLAGLQRHAPVVWQLISNPDAAFQMFALGAGGGGFEIPFIKALIDKRGGNKKGISLFCEDVSERMKSQFQLHAEEADIGDIVREYKIAPFGDTAYTPPKVNFVSSAQVWYYVGGWKGVSKQENTLEKFRLAIAEDGIGLITLYSRTSDRYILLKHLHSLLAKEEPEFPGEDVVEELAKMGICNEAEVVDSYTDVSTCFQEGFFNPNNEGKLLLSFILRTEWSALPVSAKMGVGDKLTKMIDQNNNLEMVFRDLFVWIHPAKEAP